MNGWEIINALIHNFIVYKAPSLSWYLFIITTLKDELLVLVFRWWNRFIVVKWVAQGHRSGTWSTWDWKLCTDMPPKPFLFLGKNNYMFPGVRGVSATLNLLPCVMDSWAWQCFVDVTCQLTALRDLHAGVGGIQRLRKLYGGSTAPRRVYAVTLLL